MNLVAVMNCFRYLPFSVFVGYPLVSIQLRPLTKRIGVRKKAVRCVLKSARAVPQKKCCVWESVLYVCLCSVFVAFACFFLFLGCLAIRSSACERPALISNQSCATHDPHESNTISGTHIHECKHNGGRGVCHGLTERHCYNSIMIIISNLGMRT